MEDDYRRIRSALAINYLQVFSLAQLAKVARVKVKDLQEAGGVEYTEDAGDLLASLLVLEVSGLAGTQEVRNLRVSLETTLMSHKET